MELAQAATPGPWDAQDSMVVFGEPDERGLIANVLDSGFAQRIGANAAHIVANDPATTIRHCRRDLAVLERHRTCGTPEEVAAHQRYPYTACAHCGSDPWPCEDIEWLAEAYQLIEEPT
jgi:Family of unknown function (DUF6221)